MNGWVHCRPVTINPYQIGSRCDSEVGRQKAKPTSRELIGEHIVAKSLVEEYPKRFPE
jgi:hypothetical protein